MTHAIMSPSSASRWTICPGSVVLTKDLPRTSSEFADEGTAAHELAAWCLNDPDTDPAAHISKQIFVGERTFTIDDEMADNVQVYVDLVRSIPGDMYVEQKMPINQITGEDGAHGTADAVIVSGNLLTIVDLKYGRGVEIDADDNLQLLIYAAAAVDTFDILGEVEHVRMIISQPRRHHTSDWVIPVHQLGARIGDVRVAAGIVRGSLQFADDNNGDVKRADLHPGEKQCRWCDAKGTCPALAQHVVNTVADDFVDLTKPIADQMDIARTMDNETLGNCLQAVELIESWCESIRKTVHTELMTGNTVPGFKVVSGKAGSRKWQNADEAEALFKSMRLKVEDMYDFKLISPTTAEKLKKAGTIGPRQWPKVEAEITRVDGAPVVVPVSDKRPPLAVKASADDFDDMSDDKALAILTGDDLV